MDPRVLKNYLRSSLRDTEDGGVTLTTPKAQEAWSYVRPIFAPLPGNQDTPEARNRERLLSPDIVPFSESSTTVFVRPECIVVKSELPHLRPRTLYVYGDFSPINFDDIREERLKITGTGRGGSGGHADGCVEEVVIEDGAHLVCFEKPDVVAVKISEWLEKELSRWKREIEFWATTETGKSKDGRTKLSEEWLKGVKEDADWQRRKVSAKL